MVMAVNIELRYIAFKVPLSTVTNPRLIGDTQTKKHIPLCDRIANFPYKDFTTKDGKLKTMEYQPREEHIYLLHTQKQHGTWVEKVYASQLNNWECYV